MESNKEGLKRRDTLIQEGLTLNRNEINILRLCNQESKSKHGGIIFFGSFSYKNLLRNTFYIKELCFGEKNLEKQRISDPTILISNIREKYYTKMLQVFTKNKLVLKLKLDDNIIQRRLTYTIQT